MIRPSLAVGFVAFKRVIFETIPVRRQLPIRYVWFHHYLPSVALIDV